MEDSISSMVPFHPRPGAGVPRALLAAGLVLALVSLASPVRADRDAEAEALYQQAVVRLARRTIDDRRQAIQALERARHLAPQRADIELTLGRACYEAGFLKRSRGCFERARALTPQDAEAHYGIAQVWRRDWLKYLERYSLDRAVESYQGAARLAPESVDAWLGLVPLLVERGDYDRALDAAEHAVRADSSRGETQLALAYTAYRAGDVVRAQRTFLLAYARVPTSVRERLDDIAPVASEADTATLRLLSPSAQREFVRRFWMDNDPDLTTRENEAQLEYWSRVAHAYFLFYNPRRREWDERGEVYVRYGPPQKAEYNPLGAPLSFSFGVGVSFPANSLVWHYPELGMRVLMQDRILSEYYLLPVTRTYDPDPLPDPDSLAARDGALAARSGRAVFPRLPPGVTPLPVEATIARFEGDSGPRLLGQIQAEGGPGDSLWGTWTVVDEFGREARREGRNLSPSACDATALRIADFAADLEPGTYTVGLAVRDGRGRRGVFRGDVTLADPRPGLSLSDVVISCGTSPGGSRAVRIEPNPAAFVARGDPLTAYFEIYGLAPDGSGLARFEYVYTVRSAERDPRIWIQRLLAPRPSVPTIEASRESENYGALRRQFVTVPVQSLPAGRYEIEIKVRDLVRGTEAVRRAEFRKG